MDLTKMTLAQLKEVAKEKGMKGVSTLKKQELMERIQETLSQGQEKAPAAGEKTGRGEGEGRGKNAGTGKSTGTGKACPGKA